MPLPAITFALVPCNNTARTIRRIEEILWPTARAHPDLEYEVIVSDNSACSDRELTAWLAGRGLPCRYEWNGGRNLGYGGGLNRVVRQARYERIVYLCTNHGAMSDPTWLDDILAPLDDPKVAMAGSVLPCSHACFGEVGRGIHVQGGVFAARTEALRRHPYSPRYPHLASDIWVSRELLRAGYTLADVPSVASRWAEKVSDPQKRKIVHEGGR